MGMILSNKGVPPVAATSNNNYNLTTTVGVNSVVTTISFSPASGFGGDSSKTRMFALVGVLNSVPFVIGSLTVDGTSSGTLTLTILNANVPKDTELYWVSDKGTTGFADPGGTIDVARV